jgi:hypothetical protein
MVASYKHCEARFLRASIQLVPMMLDAGQETASYKMYIVRISF